MGYGMANVELARSCFWGGITGPASSYKVAKLDGILLKDWPESQKLDTRGHFAWVTSFCLYIAEYLLPVWLRIVANRVLTTTSHLTVGSLYFYVGIWSAMNGTSWSFAIRLNLAKPGGGFIDSITYNMAVTNHALMIIFFFVIPVLIGGFGNWLVPLVLKVPDMQFPRVNAFRFWTMVPALYFIRISS